MVTSLFAGHRAMERRLAAILAADVVGYSRLIEHDEKGTLEALKERRKSILKPLVAQHHGRIVKVMGDGVLVEFASAVNAVACAVELQNQMALANDSIAKESRINLRVGVNLGDVVVDAGDLYGDGVIIAVRLQAMAEPGNICISNSVREQIGNKLPHAFEDLGSCEMKNIARPIHVFRVRTNSQDSKDPAVHLAGSTKPSIAVLPFLNMTGDPEQAYLADGLAEDLSTALAKSAQFSVPASSSTSQYKNRSVRAQDVKRDLGVDYVLEGSVRTDATRIRVTVQLVDAKTGTKLWAERFDRERLDNFAVQEELVKAIVARVWFTLIDAAAASRQDTLTNTATAYDLLMLARSAWRRFAIIETRDYLQKALEVDPDYAAALSFSAFFYSEDCFMQMSGVPVQEARKRAERYAEKAIAINAGDALVQDYVATTYLNLGKHEKAKHHFELASTLNPYNPNTPIKLGLNMVQAGQHSEGLALIEQALSLEPRLPPSMRAVPMYAHYFMRNYDKATAEFDQIDNAAAFLYLMLAMCHAQAGREEEARRALRDFEARRPPNFDVAGFVQTWCDASRLPEDKEHWREGVRKLGFQI